MFLFRQNASTRVTQTRLQAPVTPSERHLDRNLKVPGWPGVVGVSLEPSGYSPSVSQRELRELEGGFPNVGLQASCKTRQIYYTVRLSQVQSGLALIFVGMIFVRLLINILLFCAKSGFWCCNLNYCQWQLLYHSVLLAREPKWQKCVFSRLLISRVYQEQSNSISENPLSSSRNSLWDTPREQSDGSVAARVVGAATEPSDCSPGVSQRELRELERGFSEIELLCSWYTRL
jgi:hypothetical protein